MHCIHSSVFWLPLLLNEDGVTLPLEVLQSCTYCPSATGMDKLPADGFAAGCLPHLGAGLGAGFGTVGATLRNDHFLHYGFSPPGALHHNPPESTISENLPTGGPKLQSCAIQQLICLFLELASDSPPTGDGQGGGGGDINVFHVQMEPKQRKPAEMQSTTSVKPVHNTPKPKAAKSGALQCNHEIKSPKIDRY